jgi:hypothetical protein
MQVLFHNTQSPALSSQLLLFFFAVDGHLYFVSKELDLDKGTYTWSYFDEGPMPGGGSFSSGPGQLYHRGEYIYLTEDGGGSAGIYALVSSTPFSKPCLTCSVAMKPLD